MTPDYGWLLLTLRGFHRDLWVDARLRRRRVLVAWLPVLHLDQCRPALLSVATATVAPLVDPGLAVTSAESRQFQIINLELERHRAEGRSDQRTRRARSPRFAARLNHLERMRKTGLWVAEQESALRELKTALDSSSATEASA